MKNHIALIPFLLLLLTLEVSGQALDPKLDELTVKRQAFWDNLPKPQSWINDYENILTETEEQQLNAKVLAFEKETTVEIAVVTIDTLLVSRDRFDDLSLHIAKTWGVGKSVKNNGILIAVSRGYRKIRIQNGYGIETIISDSETHRMINDYFIPSFKAEKFYEGIDTGISEIIKKLTLKEVEIQSDSFIYSIDRPIEGQMHTAEKLNNLMQRKEYEQAIMLFSKKQRENIEKIKSDNLFPYWCDAWTLNEAQLAEYKQLIVNKQAYFVFEDGIWKVDRK